MKNEWIEYLEYRKRYFKSLYTEDLYKLYESNKNINFKINKNYEGVNFEREIYTEKEERYICFYEPGTLLLILTELRKRKLDKLYNSNNEIKITKYLEEKRIKEIDWRRNELRKFENDLEKISTKELKLHDYWGFSEIFFANCEKEINLLILKEIRKRKLNKLYKQMN